MSGWRWQLRRRRDEFVVDQAAEIWVLQRAAFMQMKTRSDECLVHEVVHLPSATVVGRWRKATDSTVFRWEIDWPLVCELEPGERRP